MAAATFYEIPKTTIWNSYKYFKKQTRSLCLVGLVKCYFLIQVHFGIPWADSGDTFQTYMEKPSLFFQDKIIYQYSVFSSSYLDHDVYHITPKTVLTRNHKFTRGQEEGSISGTRFFFSKDEYQHLTIKAPNSGRRVESSVEVETSSPRV